MLSFLRVALVVVLRLFPTCDLAAYACFFHRLYFGATISVSLGGAGQPNGWGEHSRGCTCMIRAATFYRSAWGQFIRCMGMRDEVWYWGSTCGSNGAFRGQLAKEILPCETGHLKSLRYDLD